MTASACAEPRCRRVTHDPSGRCHDHRVRRTTSRFPKSAPTASYDFPPVAAEPVVSHRKEYYLTGKVAHHEEWKVGERLHRLDAPAVISRHANGVLSYESYYADGVPHRLDGPAFTSYGEDGLEVWNTTWSVNGANAADRAEVFAILREASEPSRRRALVNSPYRVLLDEGHASTAVVEALEAGVTTVNGAREVLGGAPAEWVRSYEEGES